MARPRPRLSLEHDELMPEGGNLRFELKARPNGQDLQRRQHVLDSR